MTSFSVSNYSPLLSVWTLYKRECWRFLKVWNQTLLAPCVTTLLFLAILNLALGGATRVVGGMPYEQFIAPGLIMMAVVQNAFANASSSLMLSKFQGVIIDLLMPPFTGGELALALSMGGVTRGLMVALSSGAALYFFVPFTLHSAGYAIYFLVISSMFLALLGCMTGIFAQSFDQMSAITNYVITPLAFLSGTFYSIQNLPPFWQKVSHADPFFYMIDGFRYAMTGHSDGDVQVGAVVMFVMTVLMWFLVRHAFIKGWRLKS
ncbi:MAG: ABC transporter permease [Rickettsiales bacterium]|nr:ABC transporter permease [Rickettsiales bacterium]